VQRHTVYRHFPDDADLFAACSAHYFTVNPLPDLDSWRATSDPRQRLARALDELYAYYERTEPMFSNILRDAELVGAIGPTLVPMQELMAESGRDSGGRLACPRPKTARPRRGRPQ